MNGDYLLNIVTLISGISRSIKLTLSTIFPLISMGLVVIASFGVAANGANTAHKLELEDVEFNRELGMIVEYLADYSDIEIPEHLAGVAVSSIDSFAFAESELTSVILPSTLEEIGYSAFSENSLTEVTIPYSVQVLEERVFAENAITKVTFLNEIKVIPEGMFAENKLTHLVLPNSVVSIERSAFGDNQLESVRLSDSLEHIGAWAFNSNKLTELSLPDSVKFIDKFAFVSNQLTSVTLSESLEHIGLHAFAGNEIEGVKLPDSLTFIGEKAFWGNQLTQITIPKSIKVVAREAFDNNPISAIKFEGLTLNSTPSIGIFSGVARGIAIANGAFPEVLLDKTVFARKGLEKPHTLTIDDVAFDTSTGTILSYYARYTDIVIPAEFAGMSVKSIGERAFISSDIQQVIFPETLTSIGYAAFSDNAIAKVTFPASVQTLGEYSFWNNEGIEVSARNPDIEVSYASFGWEGCSEEDFYGWPKSE